MYAVKFTVALFVSLFSPHKDGIDQPDTFVACLSAVRDMPLNRAAGPSSLKIEYTTWAAFRYLGAWLVCALFLS